MSSSNGSKKRKRGQVNDQLPDVVTSQAEVQIANTNIAPNPGLGPDNFSRQFYDNLPEIRITLRALREHDRRNRTVPTPEPKAELEPRPARRSALESLGVSDLPIFASDGGPDLRDLRVYWLPLNVARAMGDSLTTPPAASNNHGSEPNQPTRPPARRSSAYDAKFAQHCKDNQIYTFFHTFPNGEDSPEPDNMDEIQQALRPPLSASDLPKQVIQDFRRKAMSESQGTVMRTIVPLIAGEASIPNEGQLSFTNLSSITQETTVQPAPDFFDGAHPDALGRDVKAALNNLVIPTKKANNPTVPNLFLEVKSAAGSIHVGGRQVTLDGAYGARAMHSLQNFQQDEPVFDGNAYTFSAIFTGGFLNLYAHHATAPTAAGQAPLYHTTLLNSFSLIGDYDPWLTGIAAFRNMRALAQKFRDTFVKTANERARGRRAENANVEERG